MLPVSRTSVQQSPVAGISRSLVVLPAVAPGAAVANRYYAQPLLHTIAGAFDVSEATAGLLMTVTQIGYVLVLAVALRRRLPRVPPTTDPALRRRSAVGAGADPAGADPASADDARSARLPLLQCALDNARLLPSRPPFEYGNAVIGLFGLAGVAGAVAASIAGRLADHGPGSQTTIASILIMLASWTLMAAGKTSAIALLIGIAVLDLAAQALHISNQSAIYALHPDSRSRLTTAYMVSCFVGASLLSALGATVYASSGWDGVSVLGAGTAGLAVVVWTFTTLSLRSYQRRLAPARGELE
jgi:predicted MFS family arabinose efflux permease